MTSSQVWRRIFAGATALTVLSGLAVVIVASPNENDGLFYVVLAISALIGLIPAIIYGTAVHTMGKVITAGALILSITATAWVVVILTREGLTLVYPFVAFWITLGIAFSAARQDARTSHQNRAWH